MLIDSSLEIAGVAPGGVDGGVERGERAGPLQRRADTLVNAESDRRANPPARVEYVDDSGVSTSNPYSDAAVARHATASWPRKRSSAVNRPRTSGW